MVPLVSILLFQQHRLCGVLQRYPEISRESRAQVMLVELGACSARRASCSCSLTITFNRHVHCTPIPQDSFDRRYRRLPILVSASASARRTERKRRPEAKQAAPSLTLARFHDVQGRTAQGGSGREWTIWSAWTLLQTNAVCLLHAKQAGPLELIESGLLDDIKVSDASREAAYSSG